MNIHQKSILFGAICLMLATLACTLNLGGPSYPASVVPVSTQYIEDLQSSLSTAVASGAESGDVTLVFTEPELTSYLTYYLQAKSQPLITNPQIYLRDGQIQVYVTATKGFLETTALVILSAGVDDQDQLKIELTSANFGPLPVPDSVKEIITATLQEAYTGAFGPVASGIKLVSVEISDGNMSITGHLK